VSLGDVDPTILYDIRYATPHNITGDSVHGYDELGVGVAPIASATAPYRNCTAAHQDGRWDIPQSDPDYWSGGDRDGDGIAGES
jgi:hypothetical protein